MCLHQEKRYRQLKHTPLPQIVDAIQKWPNSQEASETVSVSQFLTYTRSWRPFLDVLLRDGNDEDKTVLELTLAGFRSRQRQVGLRGPRLGPRARHALWLWNASHRPCARVCHQQRLHGI